MSFRLKAAYTVAVALSAVSALVATDPSLASGTNDTATAIAVSTRAMSTPEMNAAASTATETPISVVHNADGSVTVTPRTPNGSNDALLSSASTLAELVEEQVMPESLSPEMQCLAGTVYFESKGESLAGQLAVARVVINRAKSGRFPSDICGVVQQPSQFSFVKAGRIPQANTNSRDWREAVAIAQIAMNNAWDSEAEGALYFHARRVSPGWNRSRLASIDNHIFYR